MRASRGLTGDFAEFTPNVNLAADPDRLDELKVARDAISAMLDGIFAPEKEPRLMEDEEAIEIIPMALNDRWDAYFMRP